MNEDNGYSLNEFGSAVLIEAIKNSSSRTQEEIANELKKVRKNLT